jgi:hypothetical protein
VGATRAQIDAIEKALEQWENADIGIR